MCTKIIAITGSSGFLGSHLINCFKKDFLTIDLDLKKINSVNEITSFLKKNRVTNVINCVGGKSIGHSKLFPMKDFDSNLKVPTKLLYSLSNLKNTIHFTHISSAAVYGEQSPLHQQLFQPSPYANHKKIFENILKLNPNTLKHTLIVRPFSVYGPGLKKQLLWDAYHKIIDRKKENIFFGTGEEKRNFIFVEDAINILKQHVLTNSVGQIDLASPFVITTFKLVETLKKSLKINDPVIFDQCVDKGNPFKLSQQENKLIIPYNSFTSLDYGINKYVKWIKKYTLK